MDFDDAYANGKYIPGAEAISKGWLDDAAAFRQSHPTSQLDIAYGDHPRHRFDLFLPANAARGLVVFVHGGYWMKLDKDSWSHLSSGALAHNYAVMMPSYRLAPEAGLDQIAQDIAAAVTAAASRVDGPIFLSGHSAGGHLVTRLLCHDGLGDALFNDSGLNDSVLKRVSRVTSISGLHDLRPLLHTQMNATLGLTIEMAKAQSPALLQPLPQILANEIIVTCYVGADERPEFRRQNDLLGLVWGGLGLCTDRHHAVGKHHFDVIDDLSSPHSSLTKAVLGVLDD